VNDEDVCLGSVIWSKAHPPQKLQIVSLFEKEKHYFHESSGVAAATLGFFAAVGGSLESSHGTTRPDSGAETAPMTLLAAECTRGSLVNAPDRTYKNFVGSPIGTGLPGEAFTART
jgi:hypothetical protein